MIARRGGAGAKLPVHARSGAFTLPPGFDVLFADAVLGITRTGGGPRTGWDRGTGRGRGRRRRTRQTSSNPTDVEQTKICEERHRKPKVVSAVGGWRRAFEPRLG